MKECGFDEDKSFEKRPENVRTDNKVESNNRMLASAGEACWVDLNTERWR